MIQILIISDVAREMKMLRNIKVMVILTEVEASVTFL